MSAPPAWRGLLDGFGFDDLLLDSHPRSGSGCKLSGCGVYESIDADLNGAVDLLADLLFPVAASALGESSPSSGAKPAAIGHQRPPSAEGEDDPPAGEYPLDPPAGPGHDVDEEEAGVDDHEGVDALKEALLSMTDDAVFLEAKLALLFDLSGCCFDIIGVDSGLYR